MSTRHRVALAVAVAAALIAPMYGCSYPGPWWPMGPHMAGYPGWYGPGPMPAGPGWNPGQTNPTVADVRAQLERWLAWQGNPRLRLGEVVERDADTIAADVVTRENSLVQRYLVDRRSGWWRITEDEK